jgi:GntR family transcriptional regulator
VIRSFPVAAPALETDVGVTLYARIASVLRTKIATGAWGVGEMIPTLDQLCRDYGAARITVRQAIKVLIGEGLLQSHRGKGTFVRAVPGASPENKIARIIEARREHQEQFRTLSRRFVKAIPPLLAYGTNIASGEFRFVRRLHTSGDRPLFLIDIYIEKALSERLSSRQENIVAVVKAVTARQIDTEVETTVTIGSADAEVARLLGCQFATPIAEVVRLVVASNRDIVLASRATYPAEVFAMQTSQSGKGFVNSRRGSSVKNIV